MVLDCRQLFAGADSPIAIQATLDFSDREFFGRQPFSSPVYVTGSVLSRRRGYFGVSGKNSFAVML